MLFELDNSTISDKMYLVYFIFYILVFGILKVCQGENISTEYMYYNVER